VTASGLAAGLVMTGLLGLLFGSVALLLGTMSGRRAVAIGVGLAMAVGAFLLDVLAPMADWLEPWQDASPFTWALDGDPLVQGVDLPMAGLLVLVTLALFALSWQAYRRRDIATR
jgi:ABC-2 type transport system permease protein